MTRGLAATTLTLLVVLSGGGCSSSSSSDPATVQEKFGVRMAKMNLWREAMFRFRRAVELNPEDAMAHNNLAVAYEANGDFDAAAKAYREALRLDRSNEYIQKNYSRFVEFTTRDRRRQQQQRRPPAQAASAATEPAAAEPDAPPALPEPPAEPDAEPVAEPEDAVTPPPPVTPVDGDPAPTAAAPAATPAPNPAPPQTPPQSGSPPGGSS